MRIVRPVQASFSAALALVLGGGMAFIAVAAGASAWPGIAVAATTLYLGLRRSFRRWRLSRRRFPAAWRAWLEDNVEIYRSASPDDRRRFERDVQFVNGEWLFEGVGVEVTEYLHLGVCAGVAALLHGRPSWEISPPRTILFYPEQFDDQYISDEHGNYDGMAHAQGPVILSKPAAETAWTRGERGSNVILHELAHLLDFANNFADGISTLLDPSSVAAWDELVRRETHRIRFGRSVLRRYAAKDRAEFFAVAIENFFGRPDVLAHHHPELYQALVALLNLDPRVGSVVEDPG